MALYGYKSFQDCVYRGVGDDLVTFYHDIILLSVFIISLVMFMLLRVCTRKYSYRSFKNRQGLEWIWTLFPMFVLGVLWVPSARNLYVINHIGEPSWSFKAIGHQWYWTYEFNGSNYEQISIDSYIDSLERDFIKYRLLDVDQRIVAPARTQIRCLVRRVDVLHSFALPSCILKVDAIPGRMTQTPLMVETSGVIYGQCSELCGVNHSFMPIVIEFVPVKCFVMWLDAISRQQ